MATFTIFQTYGLRKEIFSKCCGTRWRQGNEGRALLRSVSSCVRNDNFKFRVKVGGPSFHVPTKEADRSLFSKGAKALSVATVIKSDELAIEF